MASAGLRQWFGLLWPFLLPGGRVTPPQPDKNIANKMLQREMDQVICVISGDYLLLNCRILYLKSISEIDLEKVPLNISRVVSQLN